MALLAELAAQGQPAVADIPAVILSSSGAQRDRERAERFGASDYIVKPHSVAALVKLLQELQEKLIFPHCGK